MWLVSPETSGCKLTDSYVASATATFLLSTVTKLSNTQQHYVWVSLQNLIHIGQ